MIFYECGICGHLHPWDWAGDCREDANRYTTSYVEDTFGFDVEIRTMEERLEADLK